MRRIWRRRGRGSRIGASGSPPETIVERFERRRARVVAVAFLVAQLAGFLHLALERHAVCADHGELVHADPGDAHASEGVGAVSERGPSLAGGSEGTQHAHCGTLPAIQPKHAASGPSFRAAPALCEPCGHATPKATARSSVPILSLAPKHSPPA
jgi:hypothetical protein